MTPDVLRNSSYKLFFFLVYILENTFITVTQVKYSTKSFFRGNYRSNPQL